MPLKQCLAYKNKDIIGNIAVRGYPSAQRVRRKDHGASRTMDYRLMGVRAFRLGSLERCSSMMGWMPHFSKECAKIGAKPTDWVWTFFMTFAATCGAPPQPVRNTPLFYNKNLSRFQVVIDYCG
jgi:hypothetical protein